MAIIESTIAPGSDAYKANRDGMLALIARMRGAGRAGARGVGRWPRTAFTSAGNCCRASAWRWCSIPARPSSSSPRLRATGSMFPTPTRAFPAAG